MDDRKFTSEFVFVYNGGTVSWKSSKQEIITSTPTEAEYVAAKEAIWIRTFIVELEVVPSIKLPISYIATTMELLHR